MLLINAPRQMPRSDVHMDQEKVRWKELSNRICKVKLEDIFLKIITPSQFIQINTLRRQLLGKLLSARRALQWYAFHLESTFQALLHSIRNDDAIIHYPIVVMALRRRFLIFDAFFAREY